MKKLRNICVDNINYLWRYRYDDYDYLASSYLLILPVDYKGAEIKISFPLIDKPVEKFMLNSGFKAIKDEKEVIINLNEPKYIAEFIQYLINIENLDFQQSKRFHYESGEQLLNKMGYTF